MALPVLQALLLADHVYADSGSGKVVICGVFNSLFFAPQSELIKDETVRVEGAEETGATIARLMRVGSPYVYLSVTDFHGAKEFELRYVDLSREPENAVLFSMTILLNSPGPLETVQWASPLPPLPITKEEPGTYALELLCENELLGSHRVLVKRNPQT